MQDDKTTREKWLNAYDDMMVRVKTVGQLCSGAAAHVQHPGALRQFAQAMRQGAQAAVQPLEDQVV
jgi:hypothetical protein